MNQIDKEYIMYIRKVIIGLVLTTLSFFTVNANAALVKVGGIEVMVADVDKYGKGGASSGTPPEILGFTSGANLLDTEGGTYEYKITFLYRQATFNNVLTAPDGQSINTSDAENSMIMGTFNIAPNSYLAFTFGAKCDGLFMNCNEVANGTNIESESLLLANFAISDIETDGNVSSFYLFLNDTGANPDNDFDDLIVYVELTKTVPPSEVPEPSTILLLGLSVLGLARFRN